MVRDRARRRMSGGRAKSAPAALGQGSNASVPPLASGNGNGNGAGARGTAATTCASVALGFDICARRTRDGNIAVAAESAARNLRSLAEALRLAESTPRAAHDTGRDAGIRPHTGQRLRWEWLASTATLVDGRADRRLLSECATTLADAVATFDPELLGDALAARLRVASAEAFSLSLAVEREVRADLVIAYA